MAPPIAPRELLKAIFEGTAPPRPLFLPVVFSRGARIENLPLRMFLSNPTKITQALRQLRRHLRSDAMSCYFDPYLEIEALGAELDWESGDKPLVRWASNPAPGELPAGLAAVDEIATRGRIPVAVEVVRRLKAMVRDEVLLTVGISGPLRLATQLSRTERGAHAGISTAALELASEVIAPVAGALVEAGANVVLINENLDFAVPDSPDLASLLATTINIVRFYRALPVLLLNPASQYRNLAPQDCVVCPTVPESAPRMPEEIPNATPASLGVAVPVNVISEGSPSVESFATEFRRLNPSLHPAVITTAEDFPDTADLKNWNKLRDLLSA